MCGLNVLGVRKRKSFLSIFLDQFKNLLVVLLLVATAISILVGEIIDAILIVAIVLFMAIVSAFQEYRAERILEALKRLGSPKARVIREGRIMEVDASEVVPGDIILLFEGDRVPADARLVEAVDLYVDESLLTGESVPVGKRADIVLPEKTIESDRINMVFTGTYVVRGRGKAIVVATGKNTYLGRIAQLVEEVEEVKTPFQEEMDKLARKIAAIVVLIAATSFLVGYILYEVGIIDLLLSSIALAVAAVPEGLPAIVTIVLSVAAWIMAKRRALVRRLAAVESLGAATVIATDKTGTLTLNRLRVEKLLIGAQPRDIKLESLTDREIPQNVANPVALIAALNNTLVVEKVDNDVKFRGDPLEVALVQMVYKLGYDPLKLRKEYKVVREIPFSSERKRMTVVVQDNSSGKLFVLVKGAPEILLERSTAVYAEEGLVRIDKSISVELLNVFEHYASEGYRLIGLAFKELDRDIDIETIDAEDLEKNLVYLATTCLIDPPRPEVPEAVHKALGAGIRVVMITGDHPATARAIAKMIGLPVRKVLTGVELEEISDEELARIVDEVDIYARVTPEHKARIVRLLRAKGHVVAVTGDGVNDAPALKLADIGVAMGKRGTDVAKEAADIIILDDNFATIVAAIEEGRKAFDNVKRTVLYLLTANTAEVATIFYSALVGIGLLLTAPMLLWINVVTDGFPAAGMAFEEAEPDIMKRRLRGRRRGVLGRDQLIYLLLIGLVFSAATLVAAYFYMPYGIRTARSAAFLALMSLELGLSLSLRRLNSTVFSYSILSNRAWVLGYLAGLALAIIGTGPLASAMKGAVLDPATQLTLLAYGHIIAITVDEVRKRLGLKI